MNIIKKNKIKNMSDGITDAYNISRKISYLKKIELKKDILFDKYIELSKRLIQINKNLIKYSKCNKNLIGKPKPDYKLIKGQEKLSFEISIRMNDILKLLEYYEPDRQ